MTTPPTIDVGATGPAVIELQTDLNNFGYGLTVDGNYGPLTYAAVTNFKANRGITDGIVGPVTWAALEPAKPPPPKPNGIPGTWNLAWSDEFTGTSIDTTKWFVYNNKVVNQTLSYPANVTVSNSLLNLKFAGTNNGAAVASAGVQGCTQPTNGYAVPVGACIEARINFPGSGHAVDNWPAFWIVGSWGGVGDETGGEIDIAEGLGSLTVNYHSSSENTGGPGPAGTWAGGFHTYAVVRGSTSFTAYWDGVAVWTHNTTDNGIGQGIILNNSEGKFGGTQVNGVTMQVDYVRVWTP